MIGMLQGDAVDDGCVLTSGGVGYDVRCPHPLERGPVSLWVHTSVREDAITLYGFAERTDRDAFQALIAVNGVGPAVALALLRDVGTAAIAGAIKSKDPKPLVAAAGVGAKVAQKIVALCKADGAWTETAEVAATLDNELVDALDAMGYDRTEARDAVTDALGVLGEAATEEAVLAAALVALRRAS